MTLCKYVENYGTHLVRQHINCLFSFQIKEILNCTMLVSLKKKTKFTYTYQIHNYIFSHTKTYYLKHNTKHIFCFINTINIFLPQFLNYNFHIILITTILKISNKPAPVSELKMCFNDAVVPMCN